MSLDTQKTLDEAEREKLLAALRIAQDVANQGHYARAFGFLESSVAVILGVLLDDK